MILPGADVSVRCILRASGDGLIGGDIAKVVAISTVTGGIVAGIYIYFDSVAVIVLSHVSLPEFALKRLSSPSGMTNVLSEFGPGSGDGLDAKSGVIQIGRVYARKVYMPCSDETHPGKCRCEFDYPSSK